MKYTEVAQCKTASSVGEIGWNVAGAAGGGLLGWILSRILHKRRTTGKSLAYTLGGVISGLAGVNYALDAKPSEGGSTWRERLQAADRLLPEVQRRSEEREQASKDKHILAWLIGGAGGLHGGYRGLEGKGMLDVSGRRAADSLINAAMQASPTGNPAIDMRTSRGARYTYGRQSLGYKGKPRGGVVHPLEGRDRRALARLYHGKVAATPDGWRMDMNTRGHRLANAGQVAADVLTNAALETGLGYGAGRLAEAVVSSVGKNKEAIQNEYRQLLDK